jgi:hypothetical protein
MIVYNLLSALAYETTLRDIRQGFCPGSAIIKLNRFRLRLREGR